MAAWSFVSEDQSRALVQGVIYRAEANVLRKRLRLRGLDPQAGYRVNGSEKSYTGSALMAGGLLLPQVAGDDVAFDLYLERLQQ